MDWQGLHDEANRQAEAARLRLFQLRTAYRQGTFKAYLQTISEQVQKDYEHNQETEQGVDVTQ